MAIRTWSSAGSTDMNNAANYSGAGALLATDDLVFDGTSVINATATAGLSVQSVSIVAAYTGAWSIFGQTLTVALGFSDDGGGGTRNYGNGITANGASSTVHFGSTLGAVTSSSCVLTMNGTTGMVLDDDKGLSSAGLVLGANANVTSSGSAVNRFQSAAPLTFISGGTFNCVSYTSFDLTVTGSWITILAGTPTFQCNNANATHFRTIQSSINATMPGITFTGSYGIFIYTGLFTNNTINLSGNVSVPVVGVNNVFYVFTTAASGTTTFNTNGYSIAAGLFVCGSSTVGGFTANFGASNLNIFRVDFSAYNSSANIINMQTSQWSCSGNWTFGSNHTTNPGTSTVTITNTSTVTSNGKSFYNFIINAAARTITLSGALTIATGGSITVTAFTAFAGNQYIIFAGSGSISIATAVSNRLRTAVAGSTITWTTGANIWTIPAYTANDWGGDASADVAWRSSTPGTQYRILAPAGVVVSNMNPQDNLNSGTDINALDGTSRDGGNNIGWLFPASGSVSARISRSRIAISAGI